MLQHEFEEKVGKKVSEEYYVVADAYYLDGYFKDNSEFCTWWKNNVLGVVKINGGYAVVTVDFVYYTKTKSKHYFLQGVEGNVDMFVVIGGQVIY